MSRIAACCIPIGLLCWAQPVHAGYAQVESFKGLTPGAIDGQEDWYASSGVNVAADPADPLNQVLQVGSLGALVRKPMLAPQGTTRMVFLRFRFEQQLSASFGMSHATAPSEFSDFGPEMNLINSQPDLRTANGDLPGVYQELTTLTSGKWYNLWLQLDTTADTTRLWLNDAPGEPAAGSNQLSNQEGDTLFGFRTSTQSDLKNFYIKTASGGSGVFGPLLIDDLYLETTPEL
ncbi:MAG: hypothetical protein KDA37_17910, partial [Planctomycetales bacterium]|nr:hypothetical protein [Planctomycetales bacterium]